MISTVENTCFPSSWLWLLLALECFAKITSEKCHLICISIHVTGIGHLFMYFMYLLIRFGFKPSARSKWVNCSVSGWGLLNPYSHIIFNAGPCDCQNPEQFLFIPNQMLWLQINDLNISPTSQGPIHRFGEKEKKKKQKTREDWRVQFIILVLSFSHIEGKKKKKTSFTTWLPSFGYQDGILHWGIKSPWYPLYKSPTDACSYR